jgi:hypothetical protein
VKPAAELQRDCLDHACTEDGEKNPLSETWCVVMFKKTGNVRTVVFKVTQRLQRQVELALKVNKVRGVFVVFGAGNV